MRFRYWTIQATPDPTRLMTFGVGVLVTDSDARDFQVNMINRLESVPSNVPNRDAILTAARHISSEINEMRSLLGAIEFSDVDSPSSYASQITRHWNNLISVDHPRFMSASNISEASDLLFRLYVEDRKPASQTKTITKLRAAVRSTYEQLPEIEKNLYTTPKVESGFLDGRFDLAIVREDDRVFELNSSFTFLPQQAQPNRERIESWNFRVDQIRRGGGTLLLEDKAIQIGKNSPIVVTYSPPKTEQQHELYESVSRQWDALEVTAVPDKELQEHSLQLQSQILAA